MKRAMYCIGWLLVIGTASWSWSGHFEGSQRWVIFAIIMFLAADVGDHWYRVFFKTRRCE